MIVSVTPDSKIIICYTKTYPKSDDYDEQLRNDYFKGRISAKNNINKKPKE